MGNPKILVIIDSSSSSKCIRVLINNKEYSWACPEISKDKESWYRQVIRNVFSRLYQQASNETVKYIKDRLKPIQELLK